MNENTLTDVVTTVAQGWWEARTMLDGRKPWDDLDIVTQNDTKEAILPFVFRTFPLAKQAVLDDLAHSIRSMRELGISDTDILFGMATQFGMNIEPEPAV